MRSAEGSRQSCCLVMISAWLALHGFACTTEQTEPASVSVSSGALGVQLNCGTLEISSIGYSITRSGMPYRSGTFAVDGPGSNFSALIGLLEPADDYAIDLDATATSDGVVRAGTTPCNGSAGFGIQLGQTTAVAVTLHCDAGDDGNLAQHSCPGVDTVRALPAEAPVGKCVALEAVADAIAARASKLSYQWAASGGGALQDVIGPRCGFVCNAPGISQISVELHDSDPACAARFPVYVTCRGVGDARSADNRAAAAGGGAAPPHK